MMDRVSNDDRDERIRIVSTSVGDGEFSQLEEQKIPLDSQSEQLPT